MSKQAYLAYAVAAILGTVAVPSVADEDVIHACVGKSGVVRLVEAGEDCRRRETPVSWNVQGPPGPAGPPGEPGATFKDTEPPTIGIDAPAIATQRRTTVTLRLSDNVELGQLIPGSVFVSEFASPPFEAGSVFGHGTTIAEETREYWIELGSPGKSVQFAVTDTSGNMAKAEVRIAPPEIPLAPGVYDLTVPVTIPAGFDCLVPAVEDESWWEPEVLAFLGVDLARCDWSEDEGYCARFCPNLDPDSRQCMTRTGGDERFPLDATSFDVESVVWSCVGVGGACVERFTGTFEVAGSAPPTIEGTFSKQCNINNEGWFSGVPVSFTALLNE